ncbi:peptidoglycan-binding protein [Xanthobacter sp. TB0139]|uniref:peptidoglycan-binding protein n=1 Tax=Xanthobacter sp. TB0139 TaxID=3459178 RepID=UPI00403967A6
MRAIDIVRRLAPRARENYVAAFAAGDELLERYGITTPLRLAHFLSQVLHETGGLTVLRESGAYSRKRIVEIFGVGRHSAGVTMAEARALAGNGPALFDRVYGLGNPRKASELGNTRRGDGWAYRGNGLMQTTGRGAHRRLGERVGLGDLFERTPDAVTQPEYALLPALAEWRESGCNALADRNDLNGITRRINGGYNGAADRKRWFDRIWPLVSGGTAWSAARSDGEILALQHQLNGLGYGITADGLKGPETERAVRDFQRRNGLKVDGIAGRQTRDKMADRLAGQKAADDPPAERPLPAGGALKSGTVQGAIGAIGGGGAALVTVADSARQVAGVHDDAAPYLASGTVLGVVVGCLVMAGGLYLLWHRLSEAGALPRWMGGRGVPA